jgi:hypothetical protein
MWPRPHRPLADDIIQRSRVAAGLLSFGRAAREVAGGRRGPAQRGWWRPEDSALLCVDGVRACLLRNRRLERPPPWVPILASGSHPEPAGPEQRPSPRPRAAHPVDLLDELAGPPVLRALATASPPCPGGVFDPCGGSLCLPLPLTPSRLATILHRFRFLGANREARLTDAPSRAPPRMTPNDPQGASPRYRWFRATAGVRATSQ